MRKRLKKQAEKTGRDREGKKQVEKKRKEQLKRKR
jgi:hypothetical protein